MPSRADILALVRAGRSYEDIGRQLSIRPGRAYLLATGLPADGSDVLGPQVLAREGLLPGGSQHLVNPPTELPVHDAEVAEWIKTRAQADAPMREATARRTAEPHPIASEDETTDVISVLGWDHNQVLSGHEETEQEYLWPADRRVSQRTTTSKGAVHMRNLLAHRPVVRQWREGDLFGRGIAVKSRTTAELATGPLELATGPARRHHVLYRRTPGIAHLGGAT